GEALDDLAVLPEVHALGAEVDLDAALDLDDLWLLFGDRQREGGVAAGQLRGERRGDARGGAQRAAGDALADRLDDLAGAVGHDAGVLDLAVDLVGEGVHDALDGGRVGADLIGPAVVDLDGEPRRERGGVDRHRALGADVEAGGGDHAVEHVGGALCDVGRRRGLDGHGRDGKVDGRRAGGERVLQGGGHGAEVDAGAFGRGG